jgi:hypothetical protein
MSRLNISIAVIVLTGRPQDMPLRKVAVAMAVDTAAVITAVVMGARIFMAAATAVGISVARISAAGVISADPRAPARLQDRVSAAVGLSPHTTR